MILFRNGAAVHTLVGAQKRKGIEAALDPALA